MIAWGGMGSANPYYFNTGARYNTWYLVDGIHTFAVRAYDAFLYVDPTPAFYSWTVDTVPPITTLGSAPTNPTNLTVADFEFYCSEAGCNFECNLDSAGWSACASPEVYFSLLAGDHLFSIRATDAAGNLELNPLIYPWTISP